MLRAENISYRIGNAVLLNETSVTFHTGKFHVIMGANGAGKSTLLKLLAGEMKTASGKVYFEEKAVDTYSKNSLAKRRAVLSQHYHLSFPVTAEEIVLMGRYPHFTTQPGIRDISICKEAMQLMDVWQLAERDYTTLSGGEAQKVQMSRVLAQIWKDEEGEKKILFLDEPVSHLDVKYQHQLLQVAKELTQQGITVIAILHDINLAISFADDFYFMKEGQLKYMVTDVRQVTPQLLQEVFDVQAKVIMDGNRPVIVF